MEGAVQRLDGGLLPGERLGVDAGDVIFERNGGGAEIAAVRGVPPSSFPAQVAQLVLKVVHLPGRTMDHQMIDFKLPHQGIDQHEGKFHLFGDLAAGDVAASQEVLHRQRLDLAVAQPGLLE